MEQVYLSLEPGELAVQATRGLAIGGVSFLRRVEHTKIAPLIIADNLRVIFAIPMQADPLWQTALGSPPLIREILRAARFTKIAETVIRASAVDMIDIGRRIASCFYLPYQSISYPLPSIKVDGSTTIIARHAASEFSGLPLVDRCLMRGVCEVMERTLLPIKKPSVPVVSEALQKIGDFWQYLRSHRLSLRSMIRSEMVLWQGRLVPQFTRPATGAQ